MRKSIFIFLLVSFNSFTQTENQKIIDGSVYNNNSYSIEGIHVLRYLKFDLLGIQNVIFSIFYIIKGLVLKAFLKEYLSDPGFAYPLA